MLPPFEATVENPRVRRGGTAVFRCNVPDSVRDHVTITSWIQDNRYDIFLTSSQGLVYISRVLIEWIQSARPRISHVIN